MLKGNLEITDLQAETVSIRQQNVRQVVEADLEVRDSFLTGSYVLAKRGILQGEANYAVDQPAAKD